MSQRMRVPERLRSTLLKAAAVMAVVATLIAGTVTANALEGAQFDAGNIITDAKFFNKTSMTQAQIQTFLEKQNPSCAATDPALPCLKNYRGPTTSQPAEESGHCAAYTSEGTETAARIIWKTAQACRINPQVLLTLLQKEQSLVTSTKPQSWQYRSATGYGCPDTAVCDTLYYGFFNQVYNAAWQFRQYTQYPNRRYKIGAVTIQYSPDTSCGSSTVTIRNQATANLYNYTPYQPNKAALANLGGTGDSCSAYGNRNFWVTFNTWFPDAPVTPVAGSAQIDAAWTSALGAATSDTAVIPGGSVRMYANGNIYWSAATGAHPVTGLTLTGYLAAGGPSQWLGYPTVNQASGAHPYGSGTTQKFTGGDIHTVGTQLFVRSNMIVDAR